MSQPTPLSSPLYGTKEAVSIFRVDYKEAFNNLQVKDSTQVFTYVDDVYFKTPILELGVDPQSKSKDGSVDKVHDSRAKSS